MSQFAVIDTETTWSDHVMSIGIAVADSITYELTDKRYYVLTPYKDYGGMYSNVLYVNGIKPCFEGPRDKAILDLINFLTDLKVTRIFAYNASFDYHHLPELSHYKWFDIMGLAAYKQHNHMISGHHSCWSTGRLKKDYGVEPIYRMLSNKSKYCELHNALIDAIDELEIMRLLKHDLNRYDCCRIKQEL